MSDQTAPAAPAKVKLTDLLKKIQQILSETGAKPGEEGFHAPTVTLLHIVRIGIARTIDHVIDLKKSFAVVFGVLQDPQLKEGDRWRSDLPTLRKQIKDLTERSKEMDALVTDIVARINPQNQAPTPTAPASAPAGETKIEEDVVPPTEIDAMAAELARGGQPDLTKLHAQAPPQTPVVPLRTQTKS